MLSSSRSFLRVAIYALQIHLVNNTGITLAQKSSALITHLNLSFQTNAEDPFLNINYEVRIERWSLEVLFCIEFQ